MNPSFQQIAELFQLSLPNQNGGEIVEQKRKSKGDTPEESEELGRLSLSEGDYELAIKHFREAISQRGTESPEIIMDIAGAYEYGDQAPQALRQMQRALRMKQESPEPLVGISDLYKRYGRFRDSIEQLQKAIEIEPNNPFLHIKLAETLRDMGERKRALSAAQNAVLAKPDEAFYHFWVGDLLIEMQRYEEALDSLRAAIELSPGDDYLYLRASIAFWRLDRKAEAIKAIRLASDLDPQKDVYHGLLEVLLEESGQIEEANLESERADKMDRYDHDTLQRTLGEMGISV